MAASKASRKRALLRRKSVSVPIPRSMPACPAPDRGNGSAEHGMSFAGMMAAVDATNTFHVPPPIPLGPYTIVKGRSTITVATNATGQYTTLLLGPHTTTTAGQRDLTVSPVVGISGVGINVPGAVETVLSDSVLLPYANTLALNQANAALHGMTVVLNCLATATSAEGQVYFGAINQRINRTRFANWNDVGLALINRRDVKPQSAYSTLSVPVKMSAYPIDVVDWARQSPLVLPGVAAGTDVTTDALSQVVLVFPPTTAVVNYSITVYTEWRINFVDAALASTATSHQASQLSTWSAIAAFGNATAGFVAPTAGATPLLGGQAVQADPGLGLATAPAHLTGAAYTPTAGGF